MEHVGVKSDLQCLRNLSLLTLFSAGNPEDR